jgi:hypothetical protein
MLLLGVVLVNFQEASRRGISQNKDIYPTIAGVGIAAISSSMMEDVQACLHRVIVEEN